MSSIFIFKVEREKNEINYIPYFEEDNDNIDYEIFDIYQKLKKLGNSKLSDIICQDNVTNYFVKKALGLEEKEYYDDEEEN